MSKKQGRMLVNDGPVNPTNYIVDSDVTPVKLYDDAVLPPVEAGQHLEVDHVTVLNANGTPANNVVIMRNSADQSEITRFGAADDYVSRPYNGLWLGDDGSNIEFILDAAMPGAEEVNLSVTWHVVTPTSVG